MCLFVLERGHVWMVCEGFQFILKNQADALLALGVHPQFKVRLLSVNHKAINQRPNWCYCFRMMCCVLCGGVTCRKVARPTPTTP